jgi:hypothetical protein
MPRSSRFSPVTREELSGIRQRRLPAVIWPIIASLCLSLVSGEAWGRTDAESGKEGSRPIVAAGFGFQIGDLSAITVKVYDAKTGEVLSDDLYELNVNEGNGSGSAASQERIFAGGVGLGAADLSNFMLRVYDAKTGEFQWEGLLSLTPRDGGGTGQMVSTVMPRRAAITKVYAVAPSMQQPVFVLRALDVSTGGLVWADEFSTDGIRIGQRGPSVTRLVGLNRTASEAFNTYDFRIRMIDGNGQAILWEDRVFHREAEEDSHDTVDDQAHMLPVWPRELQQASPWEAI